MFATILSNIPQENLIFLSILIISMGLLAGFLAGFFGIGGGVVVVPALYYLFTLAEIDENFRMHLAVGTSLANIIPISIISAFNHAKRKSVDFDLLKVIFISVFIGVAFGSVIVSLLKGSSLMLIYSSILFLVALQFFFWKESWKLSDTFPSGFIKHIYGSSIGFLSVLIGVGGGSISVPILKMYNFPIHKAIGTGAAIGTLVAIPGTIGFIFAGINNESNLPLSLGYVNFLGLLMITPMTMVATPFGVKLAHHLSKEKLNLVFASFILIMSIKFFIEWLSLSF